MNNNILITSAGRRVSLVRAFQKELKELYPNAKVLTTDLNPKFPQPAKFQTKQFQFVVSMIKTTLMKLRKFVK